MLQQVSIQNFALIDQQELNFSDGFTVITGETGSGKSILLGALGLVLGNRADSSVLHNKQRKCIVEVIFDLQKSDRVKAWLIEQGLDADDALVLRREIAAAGKSRSFINDTPVTLAQLKEVTSQLVDLHQQFDTMELGESYFQRNVIDALAQCTHEAAAFAKQFKVYTDEQARLLRLVNQQQQQQREQDYRQYLLDELQEASFQEQELEEAEQELKLLEHAEAVTSTLNEACYLLKESETPLVQQLKQLLQKLQQYNGVSKELAVVCERLSASQIELNDIAAELEHLQDTVQSDEARREQLTRRLELGYKLQKKHGVHSTRELLHIQQQLEDQLQTMANLDVEITATQKLLQQQRADLEQKAAQLQLQRKNAAAPFTEKLNTLLKQVGMPNARMIAEVKDAELHTFGADSIRFLFNANLPAGAVADVTKFEPINKVASGGELSRLMLCIQSLVAGKMELPSLIFDEIDSGISGEAARQVGLLLQELAQRHQVITITHLPQIAARAKTHFYVYKETSDNTILTKVKQLQPQEQVEAIARMLGGSQISESTLQTAREMVMNQS